MGRKKLGGIDLCDSLEMGGREKEPVQQVICYRPGDKTRGFVLEEQRGRLRTAVNLLPWLEYPVGSQGVPAWDGECDKALSVAQGIR